MKSPASIKEYVRSQHPEKFEGWDGFMTIFTAVECRDKDQESMLLTLINESKVVPNLPEEKPHAVFQLDVNSGHDDIIVVSWNGQAKAAD